MLDFINTLKNKFSESQSEKNRYALRWARIAKLCGVNDPMAVLGAAGLNINKSSTEQFGLDDEIYDPIGAESIFTLSNYTISMLFGQKQKFNLKANLPNEEGFYRAISEAANREFYRHETNFASATRQVIEGSVIPFGNGGYFVKYSKDDNCVKFEGIGAADGYIMEGKYGEVDTIFHLKLITPREFEKTFGEVDNKIKEKYKDANGQLKDFRLVHCITKNPDYTKGASERNGCKYLGIYWVDSCASDWFFEENYHYRAFCYNRTFLMRGELYGRSNVDKMLASIDSSNELTRLADEACERSVHGAIGIMAELNGDTVINLQPDGVTVMSPMPGQNGSPIFQMQPVGDPSAVMQIVVPRYDKHIPQGLGLNMFFDLNPIAMTARQSLDNAMVRNRNLMPIYLGYREQILLPLITAVVDITIKEKLYSYKGKIGKGGYEIIPSNSMEEVYTNDVVAKLMEINNIFVSLQGPVPDAKILFNVYAMVKEAIKGSKYETYFVDEQKFMQRVEAYYSQQAAQMQMTNNASASGANKNLQNSGKAQQDVEAANNAI